MRRKTPMAESGSDPFYDSKTWSNMLNDLVSYSGGEVVSGPDTELNGKDVSNMVQQYLLLVE